MIKKICNFLTKKIQESNPEMDDEKAEIRDIMKLLGLSIEGKNAINKFKKMLLNFTINYQGKDYYLFGAHTFEYGKEFRTYFVINPLVDYYHLLFS